MSAGLNKLSARKVKTAPPGKYSDGGGLWLHKRPDGGAQWFLRVTIHGRRREMGLGPLHEMPLKEAREEAEKWRGMTRKGIDPIKERERLNREAARNMHLLADIATDAFESRKAELKGDGKAGQWFSPLALHILPMSNDPCPTFVELSENRRVHFEEYLVRDGSPTDVESIDLSAAAEASPAPGVLQAIEAAQTILVCPSNPIVSIGPILAVPGIREALAASSAPIVAVSPIVRGAPIKGPAHTLLRAQEIEVSALGVARFYQDWIDGFVFDERDDDLMGAIEALGLEACTLDTMMVDADVSERVALASLDVAGRLADRVR